jgi:hypothetical protein
MDKDFTYSLSLYIDKQDISSYVLGIKSLSFGASINSLYPSGILTLFLPSEYIEQGFLSVGSDISFGLKPANSSRVITKSYKIWKIACLSNESSRSLTGMYSITFIHPWFFKQDVKSKAYIGTAYYAVYQLIVDEFYKDFSGLYLDVSIDSSSKHYRTYQTAGNFLEERMYDKYLVDNSPTFMYVNQNNDFCVKSFLNMIKGSDKNIAYDSRTVKETDVSLERLKTLDKVLYPLSLGYSLNESGFLWNKINTEALLLQVTDTSSTAKKLSKNSSLFDEKGFYPINKSIKNSEFPLSMYIDDSQQSTDHVYSSFLQKQKSVLSDQTFDLICKPNFTVDIGQPVDFILKKNESQSISYAHENSMFYATYVISEIKHTLINTSFFTTVTLCKDMINPIDPALNKKNNNYISSTNFFTV